MFTHALARFIANTQYRDLPPEVVKVAKYAILDFIGVAMAGSQDPSGRMISELVKENRSAAEATVIGWRFKASPSLAALANGSAGHVLDYDDCLDYPVAGLAHPTTGSLPGALAMAEKLHIPGRNLITAYCLALETYGKLGLLTRESWVGQRGWEWTGVLGAMGSVTAVSRILNLDADRTETALGIGATMASGLIRNFGTMAGHLHGGDAARNGVEAASLAHKGYTGRHGIVEIPRGFYNAFTGTSADISEEDMQEKAAALGNPWNIIDPGLMFKAFPCCHIGHFGVDAGLQLRKKYNVDWRQIDEIEFHVPSILKMESATPEPKIGVQARFSLPYCLSRALIQGKMKISDFSDEGVKDPLPRQLMKKVRFVMEEQDRANGVFGSQEVVLKMNDGNVYRCRVEHARGEPQNPQSPEEFEAKYRDCAETAHYDEKTATRIKDMILDLENVEDVSQVMALMG